MFNSNNAPFTMPVMPANSGGYGANGAWGDGGWLWIIVVFALLFGWGSPDSFDFCFDGLSQGGTVAVSTTGCFWDDGQHCFEIGYREMIRRLHPDQVLVVGPELQNLPRDLAPVVYLESYGQQIRRRSGGQTVANGAEVGING